MLESCFSGSSAESSQNVKNSRPQKLRVWNQVKHYISEGFFLLKISRFFPKLPKMAQTSILASPWCTAQEPLELFVPLFLVLQLGSGCLLQYQLGRAWSCVLPVPKPTRGFGIQSGEPRWSLFSLCSWTYRISQESLAKSAAEPAWSNTAIYRSHFMWAQSWLCLAQMICCEERKEKTPNQADSGILEVFIQWEDFQEGYGK